jgi:2-polyprenyl-3-methyl-5-hydroxy-6-metoxy-1,4-benzoquinol methylase
MLVAAQGANSPYYTNPRADLKHLIPREVKRALDVGCGAGAFGAVLKASRGAEVWGVECRADVADVASTRLSKVITGDAAVVLPTLPESHFDLIAFNDVLEHMVDPESILRSSARLLAPNGVVMVSLPNLRFWTDFGPIVMQGEFEYQDLGLLDRTHLRFFTRKSILGFFARSGFRIIRIEGLNPTPSRTLTLANLVTFGRFRDCRYSHFAVIAKPVGERRSA